MRIQGDRLATKKWIRRRVWLYANRLSLPQRPIVVFSQEEWANSGFPYRRGDLDSDARGHADPAVNAIMVNLEGQLCRHDADDTAAHETLHLRFPSMGHDKNFQARVDLVRKGLRLGPAGSRLPPHFPR